VLFAPLVTNFQGALQWVDTVPRDSTYSYRVRARDGATPPNYGPYSTIVSATTPANVSPAFGPDYDTAITTLELASVTEGQAFTRTIDARDLDSDNMTFIVTANPNSLTFTGGTQVTTTKPATISGTAGAAGSTLSITVSVDDGQNAAEQDWAARSTAAGVVVAYDFSAPPANGGTWDYGSLSASPKVTCEVYNHAHDARRYVDTTVYPPGSTASLLFNVPTNTGEAGDQWRVSIDNYADQFGAGDTFWVQWRTRMNSTMASTLFMDYTGSPTYTAYKMMFCGNGMQTPTSAETGGAAYSYYGYQGAGTQASNNLRNTITDSIGEIVVRNYQGTSPVSFKYPGMYTSHEFFQSLASTGAPYYLTHRNEGNEASHTATCQYNGSTGAYTDYSTCFVFPADQWFTMMVRVTLGAYGTATSSLGGTITGYTNSTCEYYGQMTAAQPMQLLHRRTGVVFQTYEGTPQGSQGKQKYGMFGFTTFMTRKDPAQAHPDAKMWVSQVIVSRNQPSAPAY
jgi:hypothetical protein